MGNKPMKDASSSMYSGSSRRSIIECNSKRVCDGIILEDNGMGGVSATNKSSQKFRSFRLFRGRSSRSKSDSNSLKKRRSGFGSGSGSGHDNRSSSTCQPSMVDFEVITATHDPYCDGLEDWEAHSDSDDSCGSLERNLEEFLWKL